MLKRIVSVLVAVLFVFCCTLSYAQAATSKADYRAQLDKLNQQMRDARDTYKQQMRDVDQSILKQMQALDPKDNAGRKKLIQQKRDQKNKLQSAYQQAQKSTRAQVKKFKQANKGLVRTTRGSKPSSR